MVKGKDRALLAFKTIIAAFACSMETRSKNLEPNFAVLHKNIAVREESASH